MRAVVWGADGNLSVVDRSIPEARPGWVRIRVATTGICGTDLHFFRGDIPAPAGLLPGHEIGGWVDACGDGVDLPIGAAVAVEPLIGCGLCERCLSGDNNRCVGRTLFGVTTRGGMAEYATVPQRCVHLLPAGLEAADGALAEPLAVAVRGARLAGVAPGDRVAVLGAGTIGLMSMLVCRAAGASVSYTARHSAQHDLASRCGARPLDGSGFDVVMETVGGRADTLNEAVHLARPGAVVVMLGLFAGTVELDGFDAVLREITLVGANCYGSSHGRRDFSVALELLAANADLLRQFVTHRFPLEEVSDAFETAQDKRTGSIKVTIDAQQRPTR